MNPSHKKKNVLILGGSGFVGSALSRKLSDAGHQVSIVTRRSTAELRALIPSANWIELAHNSASAREKALAEQDVLINLCAILHESSSQKFQTVHVDLVADWAQSAASAGVGQVLHVSALRADMDDPPSAYLRSKAAGERALIGHADALSVRIFRPSIVFGAGDHFFGQFAGMLKWAPIFPLVCPNARFAPVWVEDVAQAMVQVMAEGAEPGPARAYDLCGPRNYSFRDLLEFTARAMGHKRLIVGVPDWMAQLQGRVMQVLPNPIFTLDNYRSLQADNVCSYSHFQDLGISPASLERIMTPLLAAK